MKVYHILSEEACERFKQAACYAPPSLAGEGFVHLSYEDQVCRVANFIFKGRKDLVLLELDSHQLDDLVPEANPGGVELFPHLYAALKWEQVERVYPFPCNSTGQFILPNLI